jgi:hypothetical protein
MWVENEDRLPLPNVGDVVQLYGEGIGRPVRGIVTFPAGKVDVNAATVYRYETEDGFRERTKREQAEKEKRDQEAFEAELPEYNKKIYALPMEFQKRIRYFMERDGWGRTLRWLRDVLLRGGGAYR